MSDARCVVCGKPMPPGEEMFRFHGYSGPCPGSPLQGYPELGQLATAEARAVAAEAEVARLTRLVAHYEAALGRENATRAYKGALADRPEAVRQSGTVAQLADERALWAERLTAAEQVRDAERLSKTIEEAGR